MIAGGAATAGNGQQQQQQQRSRCLIYLNDIEACAQCVQRLKTELAKEVAEGFEVRMRAHRKFNRLNYAVAITVINLTLLAFMHTTNQCYQLFA